MRFSIVNATPTPHPVDKLWDYSLFNLFPAGKSRFIRGAALICPQLSYISLWLSTFGLGDLVTQASFDTDISRPVPSLLAPLLNGTDQGRYRMRLKREGKGFPGSLPSHYLIRFFIGVLGFNIRPVDYRYLHTTCKKEEVMCH